jgi:hypothetical protein
MHEINKLATNGSQSNAPKEKPLDQVPSFQISRAHMVSL